MRILQINKYLKIVGGAETYMFQLSKALQDLGHEVKFWGMQDPDNLVCDFPELEAENIDFSKQSISKKLGSVLNTIYSKSNRKKIGQVLDTYQPDIVHIHNYNFQLTPSILPEIKKRNIKVVQTVHDSQMVCPYHRIYNFQRDKVCTKCVTGSFTNCIKDRCFDGSLLKSTVGTLESYFYHSFNYYEKYIDTFISPSPFLASLLAHRIDKKIEILPNFTEVDFDSSKAIELKEYYLYYGRISEEKGIIEMIDVFKETDLHLVLIGKGGNEQKVEDKIKNIKNIEFLGPKYGKELFNYVKNAKYVVQISKGYENCPMTVIESFALSVPVIASNHSGFKDLIQNKITGFLVDFTNKNEVIKELEKINTFDISFFQKNINDFYNKNLAKKKHLEKLMKLYNTLLNKQ